MCNVSKTLARAADTARRNRAETAKEFVLVSLKKDGTPSRMQDATQRFADEAAALAHVVQVRKLNPARKMRWTLNGTEV